MKSKINDNGTLKSEAIQEILTALVEVEFKGLSPHNGLVPLHRAMLKEVLVNNKTFGELKGILKLTTFRQRELFKDAVRSLKIRLDSLNNIYTDYQAIEKELEEAKSVIKHLEAKIEKDSSISPEIKKKLAVSIGKAGFSSRVQGICSYAGLHTLSDLVHLSKREFSNIRNCGKTSVDEVEAYLNKNGLSWKMINKK